jgi:hypothetical protein
MLTACGLASGLGGHREAGQRPKGSTMALEQRHGNVYYYRKRKRGGRVLSEYIGAGDFAELAALHDQAKRERRAQMRQALRAVQAAASHADAPVRALLFIVADVVKRILESRGWHQHKRQWRKRRMELAVRTDAPPTRAEIERLIDAAMAGDRPELAVLRETMEAWPAAGRHYDLAEIAITALIKAMPSNKAHKAITRGRVAALRRELGGDHPSPIERLLIDQIVLCYIHLYQVEYQMTSSWEKPTVDMAAVAFWEERAARCQLRYLRAIKAHDDHRQRFRLPSVQINIADQQVNIAKE